ncbi:MAG: hypothetical protein Ta2B_05230 [Termitinemataceae bacterium]|nr:MAG: hypothetical protein Ta2B_05230 [Termitinemataceae bacterium]
MLQKKILLAALFVFLFAAMTFGQASVMREYVGIIDGTYHPDALSFFDKLKENYKKKGKSDVVKAIDNYIKLGFGTGFVYVAPDGSNYVITNYHVIAQTSTLSISFERIDGSKTTYNRLKVVAADEDIDIAILNFDGGGKPFKAGLAFVSKPVEEGADIFAAGFPGMFNEQIWQFSKGVVSNALMRWPHDIADEEGVSPARWGPFIQHTAAIDHGNSGGPLLVQQAGATGGYVVAGINARSLSGYRENTFFSIPAERALAYINEAVKPKSDAAQRQNLDLRLNAFIKSLAKPKAVYDAIAPYLSNACVASNAEYAIIETFSRAPRTVQSAIDNEDDAINAMQYCVAWLIEDSFRGKSSSILRATLGEITKNTDGTYNVPFKFGANGERVITTAWALEFGIWKLDKAGDLVSGDKLLLEKKEKQLKRDIQKKENDNYVMLSIGYTNIFDHWAGEVEESTSLFESAQPLTNNASALELSIFLTKNKYTLYHFSVTFADKFWQFDADGGFSVPIDIKEVTIAPYALVGINVRNYDTNDKYDMAAFDGGGLFQGGLMVTTSFVQGLYVIVGYQYNASLYDVLYAAKDKDTSMLRLNIGYAF